MTLDWRRRRNCGGPDLLVQWISLQMPYYREHSLYGWSPVLQVWIQLLHYIQKTTYFLTWSCPLLLNWRPAVQWSFPNFECSLDTGYKPQLSATATIFLIELAHKILLNFPQLSTRSRWKIKVFKWKKLSFDCHENRKILVWGRSFSGKRHCSLFQPTVMNSWLTTDETNIF